MTNLHGISFSEHQFSQRLGKVKSYPIDSVVQRKMIPEEKNTG